MMKTKKKITTGGNLPLPGRPAPTVIITQPRRFFLDMQTYMNSIRGAENVDFTNRIRLYDLYEDILTDGHLDSVRDKRIAAARCVRIEFRRDGRPDDTINRLLKSPWFFQFIEDLVDSVFWGFSLFQFYRGKDGWPEYVLVPRKHVDPVRQLILHRQGDTVGTPWTDFRDVLFVGKPRALGKLANAAPYVIYKRNDMADWAQFCEIFGMPIREYTYDAEDEEARVRILDDMGEEQGSAACFIHPKGCELKLLESTGKSGSSDLYDRFYERCNNEISKIFLGNTLTTEASERGTQALGTVQEKGEKRINESDRQMILNVLNYDMADIFESLGYDTRGGEFVYVEPKETNISTLVDVMTKMRAAGTPVSDDTFYEKTGIPKPENYDELKREAEKKRKAAGASGVKDNGDELADSPKKPSGKTAQRGRKNRRSNTAQTGFKSRLNDFYNHLRRFFVRAPKSGAFGW